MSFKMHPDIQDSILGRLKPVMTSGAPFNGDYEKLKDYKQGIGNFENYFSWMESR